MLALDPRVVGAVWSAIEPNLPVRSDDEHPLGCHRPRICDRDVLDGILFRLVTGCSWAVAGRLGKGGETTLRTRFNEWVTAGIFDTLVIEALSGFDKIIGLDLEDAAIDGSIHKAPGGGEGTGKSPVDRGKVGWKWSIATDRYGIPVGWVCAGANVNDAGLIGETLDSVAANGLLADISTLHLDRGYDNQYVRADCFERGVKDLVIAERKKKNRAKGTKKTKAPARLSLGLRWPVERTNSWLSNFGQLRRNTDRLVIQRMAQLALAIALILTVKLMKWAIGGTAEFAYLRALLGQRRVDGHDSGSHQRQNGGHRRLSPSSRRVSQVTRRATGALCKSDREQFPRPVSGVRPNSDSGERREVALAQREAQRGASDGSPLPPSQTKAGPLDEDHDGHSSALRRPGREFLQSALLLLLSEKPRHGYALTNAVGELGLGEMDRPRIYRALAELEVNGMVKVWDETSQAGHTRRVYSVTDCGHQSLHSAVTKVVYERDALNSFLERYGRMTPKQSSSEWKRHETYGPGHLA